MSDTNHADFVTWPRRYRYDTIWRRLYEAWRILRGRISIHQAWQGGYDAGTLMEQMRQLRGGK